SRVVRISSQLANRCAEYLAWKNARGEPVTGEAPVFRSSASGSFMTTRGLQLSFARSLRRAGVAHRGIHCARHTFATELYRASGHDLHLVQRQLGHASLATTQIYLALFDPLVHDAVEGLYAQCGTVPG